MSFPIRRLAAAGAALAATIAIFAIPMSASAASAPVVEHLQPGMLDTWIQYNQAGLQQYWSWAAQAQHAPSVGQPAGVTWVNEQGGTDTACGLTQSADAVDNGSFYCDKDDIIYLDKTRLLENDQQWGIPGILSSMAHEWGHHVQHRLGLLDGGQLTPKQTELQADCLAGAYMHFVRQGNTTQGTMDRYADLSTLMARYYAIGDQPAPDGYAWANPHGSPAERQSAFAKGWDLTNTPSGCTDWRP